MPRLIPLLGAPFGRKYPLTISGGVITDAVRAAGVEGDGLPIGSGLGVWEATTNLCTNGAAGTNTTGWSAGGTSTIERVSCDAEGIPKLFGDFVFKATFQDSLNLGLFPITLTAALHAGSCHVYIPTDFDATNVRFGFSGFASGVGNDVYKAADLGLRDQWQRVDNRTITPDPGDLSGLIVVTSGGTPTPSRFIYFSGVQVEAKPISTPYVHTDGGTASRSAATPQIPNVGQFLGTPQGWTAHLVRMGWASNVAPGPFPAVWKWGDDVNDELVVFYRQSTSNWEFKFGSSNPAGRPLVASTHVAGDLVCIIADWTPNLYQMSINGAAFTGAADPDPEAVSATGMSLGWDLVNNAREIDSNLLAFALGAGTLTDADAATINTILRNNPSLHRLVGALPAAADVRACYNGLGNYFEAWKVAA